MKSLATRPNQKLTTRFYCPIKVFERVGTVAYKLRLPETSKMHLVFHVFLLKQSIGSFLELQPLPTTLTEEGELVVKPEQVLAERYNN